MRKLLLILLVMFLTAMPVSADEFTAPVAPDSAQELMPLETTSFGKDLWKILQRSVERLQPEWADAARLCIGLLAVALTVSIVQTMPGNTGGVVRLVTALTVASLLLQQTGSMVSAAVNTVQELSEYGKLLLPVMAAATASQGGVTTSTAIYAGTMIFNMVLCTAIKTILIPLIYVYLVLSIAGIATDQSTLDKLRDFVRWLSVWILKIVLYVFTGYIGITGVVTGTADAASLKAAKLTISGMVPVVGSILSDASEAVLAGTGVMKSAVGIYGVLTLIALWIMPFLQIGIRYLLLKATAAICQLFGAKDITEMISTFSDTMGLLLGITAGVSVMLMISTVCFMKGVG